MQEKKILMVANPASGTKKSVEKVVGFKEYLDGQDIAYDFYYTSKQRNAQKTVSNFINDKHTDLVILGGDGTINECVNGFGDHQVPISIIPTGTGNDFTKMLNIGKNTREQFQTAVSGNLKTIDVGKCNDRYFVNGVGIGFDGEIVFEMLSNNTLLTGQTAYYYHVLKILSTYKERPFYYSIDGEPFENKLILLTIANGTTFGGGFKLTPDAKLDDGFLDVCQIGKLSPAKRYLNILRLQKGSHNILDAVTMFKAKQIHVKEGAFLKAHMDGEYIGKPPFHIKIEPSKIKVRIIPKR